eukprot:COSAG06_NODE_9195_length_1960_cov_2.680279_4_plen_80_part_01
MCDDISARCAACACLWLRVANTLMHSLARSHSYRLTVHAAGHGSVGGSAAIMITTSFMRLHTREHRAAFYPPPDLSISRR